MAICYCGKLAADRVAWTDANAGRRFRNCIEGSRGCNYFQWVDGPLCSRAQIVIPGLLRRLNNMEADYEMRLLEVQNSETRKWRIRLLVVLSLWLFVWLFSGSEKE